ncbi:MAG: hypothetical protein J5545_13655 [Bacteroidaceae bacterium]|nr:hypothetical protein [Bacteroidaceae bacterium]
MAAVNTCFKKSYTLEEVKECYEWFQQRMDKLPPSLEMPAAHIPDLHRTVQRMIKVLQRQMNERGTYNGQFAVLEQMRVILQKEYQL